MNTLFVGIDVSTKHNQACAINFDQSIYFNNSFDNSPEGSQKLFNLIVKCVEENNYDSIIIVAESTSVYDYHVCAFLAAQLSNINSDIKVYSVNAKTIANYKKSYIEVEKTDPADAFICADFARVGRTKKLVPFRANQTIALKRLTRERVHLAEQLAREKAYTLNNIYLKFSGLLSLNKKDRPFSDNFSAISSKFLTDFPYPYSLEDLSIDQIIAYLKVASNNQGTADYEKMANLLKNAVKYSYRLDNLAYNAITISISTSLALIECIEKQIKVIDKAIEKEMRGLFPNGYQSLLSITGIGPVFAAGILAEIGDISYFSNDAALAKYAGLTWKRNESGDFKSDDKRNTNGCNTYLKYYICQATQLSVVYNFDFTTDFYWKKYNEAKTHKQRRALVLTSRKLVRLIYVLLRDNKLYAPVSHDTGK